MKIKVLLSSIFLLMFVAGTFAQTKKHTTASSQKQASGTAYDVTFSIEQTLVYYQKDSEVKKLTPTSIEKVFNVSAANPNDAVNKAEKQCIAYCAKEEFVREEKKQDPDNSKKEIVYKVYARNNMKSITSVELAK